MVGVFVTTLASFMTVVVAGPVSFRGTGQLGRSDVKVLLNEEVAKPNVSRVLKLQDELRQMFTSLPKNERGHLEHEAVRFAVHRFFMHKYGWHIHSIEPDQREAEDGQEEKDRVPLILEEAFEKLTADEKGADLPHLGLLVATLEDLVTRESEAHLRDAYFASGSLPSQNVSGIEGRHIMKTYLMSFLLEHNLTVFNNLDLKIKTHHFESKYPQWENTQGWFDKTYESVVSSPEQVVDFQTASEIATKIGQEFHTLNDDECAEMRSMLQGLESRKPGRVRLSVFYNMSIHSHWDLNENVETLRDFGALDESDPNQLSVIIPNYALARANCVNASNIFEICCKNECEGIMVHLEREIGASESVPERIADAVSSAPSRTVPAPRKLDTALLGRLQEIAAINNGQVPLHGRLFAQWLHHAYPLECPFPHEQGTAHHVPRPGKESEMATIQEMRKHVEADTCAVDWEGKVECAGETVELPWNPQEKLLSSNKAQGSKGSMPSILCVILLGTALSALLVTKTGSKDRQKRTMTVSAVLLILLAYEAGVLDGKALCIATVGGVAAKVASRYAASSCNSKGCCVLPTQSKFV